MKVKQSTFHTTNFPNFSASTSAAATMPPTAKCLYCKKKIRAKDDHSECQPDPPTDDSDEAEYVETESESDNENDPKE